MRIARAEEGNLGDVEHVGSNVSEMRIFVGKGHRVYFSLDSTRKCNFQRSGHRV